MREYYKGLGRQSTFVYWIGGYTNAAPHAIIQYSEYFTDGPGN